MAVLEQWAPIQSRSLSPGFSWSLLFPIQTLTVSKHPFTILLNSPGIEICNWATAYWLFPTLQPHVAVKEEWKHYGTSNRRGWNKTSPLQSSPAWNQPWRKEANQNTAINPYSSALIQKDTMIDGIESCQDFKQGTDGSPFHSHQRLTKSLTNSVSVPCSCLKPNWKWSRSSLHDYFLNLS